MRRLSNTILAAALAAGNPALAAGFAPALPDAAVVLTAVADGRSSHLVPTAAFDGNAVPGLRATGFRSQTVLRTPGRVGSTYDLMAGLRDQLVAAGYEVLFECDTRACGGFDFRFGIDVAGEPEMHVDLGDFRFLSASLADGPTGPAYVTLLVSRSAERGYIQIATIGDEVLPQPTPAPATVSTKTPDAAGALPLEGALREFGSAVLESVTFVSGAGEISSGQEALAELAGFLNDDPARKVMLVGHTDAVGSLDGNIRLSKVRARSVRHYLIETFGVAPDQVGAEGVGYLSPRATNQTEEGRARNRRVEVVLTPAE